MLLCPRDVQEAYGSHPNQHLDVNQLGYKTQPQHDGMGCDVADSFDTAFLCPQSYSFSPLERDFQVCRPSDYEGCTTT